MKHKNTVNILSLQTDNHIAMHMCFHSCMLMLTEGGFYGVSEHEMYAYIIQP